MTDVQTVARRLLYAAAVRGRDLAPGSQSLLGFILAAIGWPYISRRNRSAGDVAGENPQACLVTRAKSDRNVP
jgi:hypothetical protein